MYPQLRNHKFYVMVFTDAGLFALSLAAAYYLRFEFSLDPYYATQLSYLLPWVIPLKLGLFMLFGLYRGMWRYTGLRDFWRLAQACFVSTLVVMAAILVFKNFTGFSRAVFLLDGGLTFLLTGGLRMAIRTFLALPIPAGEAGDLTRPRQSRRVLIVGAAGAGEKIMREIQEDYRLHYDVRGFVDDDARKHGFTIHGVPVLGAVASLPDIVARERVKEVLIALPSASGDEIRHIVGICKECDVSYKTVPGIGQIIDGRVSVKALRDVRLEDLLGRESVELDTAGIQEYLMGRRVLVTGGGGSIGSELCRQIVQYRPAVLVLVDSGEANLYHIEMALRHEESYPDCRGVLGRVQDRSLMAQVFEKFRPEVVFHAAAYKHVPLLEKNPWEAVTNNIVGSRTIMELAVEYGVDRFVLVSTDKAVRPANVMGASKRVAELLLQSFQGNGTKFMAVRFGNVVGSSGSVVPLFRGQIEQGVPVTVTHPEVTRYFMTIPEAAQMILQAGAMGEGGEIFILRMGTPVKIADMARDLIRLSGKEPDKDIRIVFTGLREGEKLQEELITVGEGIVPTGHEKIMVLRSDGIFNGSGDVLQVRRWLDDELSRLYEAAVRLDARAVREALGRIVPEYTPQESDPIL